MRLDDLIVTIAYFSIPLQLLVSLSMYPRLASMPVKIVILFVLFAFFIFLCGAGHLLRCLDKTSTTAFIYINAATAFVSLLTASYMLPLVPSLMALLDKNLQDLVELNRETNESKKKLFTFMAFLCHEIRNPLFAITSSVDCLEDTQLTQEQSVAVMSIMDSSHLMLRLANDVLDLSKIDAGKLELEETIFDLHRLLESLAHSMTTQVEHRHHGRVVMGFAMDPTEVPPLILGDSVRILQIIYNLCSNAIKFTPKGRVDMKVGICTSEQARKVGLSSVVDDDNEQEEQSNKKGTSAFIVSNDTVLLNDDEEDENNAFSMSLLDSMEHGDSHQDYDVCQDTTKPSSSSSNNNNKTVRTVLCIEVSDTGTGIPPERLMTIFEPYSQSKLSDYRQHGGTGLGLSIISGLVKAMEGKITVQSSLQQGSTFLVYLPVKVVVGSNNSKHVVLEEPFNNNSYFEQQQQQDRQKRGSVLPVILSSRRLPDLKATTSGLLTPTSSSGDVLNGTAAADNQNNNLDSLADLGHVSTSDLMATLDDRELRTRTPPTAIKPVIATSTRSISPTSRNDGNGSIISSNQHDSFSTEDLLQSLPGPTTTKEVAPPPSSQQQLPPPTAPSSSSTSTTTTITSPTTNTRRKSKPKLEPFSFAPDEKVVLVVDDNQVNLKIIGKMLTHFHLEYHTAENGRIAADKVIERSSSSNNKKYALVLMDICMPVMDGYSSIQEIRRHDSCRDIPIIALTANALSTERDRAVEVGANGFHTKPILRHDLHALCTRFLIKETTNASTMDGDGDGEDARKRGDLLGGTTMMNGGETNGINGTTENNGANLINASTERGG